MNAEPSHIDFETRQQADGPARAACFWLLAAILLWAPFPLGSNREWSWSVLTLLTAGAWLLWSASGAPAQNIRRIAVPLVLALAALAWAVFQILPFAPAAWIHPVWPMASGMLGRPAAGAISIDPWHGFSEITKLATGLAMTWLVFVNARNPVRARKLLNVVVFGGAAYALYGFALGLLGFSQYALFYAPPLAPGNLSGPFVLHNSFATFEGLAALAAVAVMLDMASARIVASRGLRRWVTTTLQFCFASGIPWIVAAMLCLSAVVASASRGGVFAMVCGLAAMALPVLAKGRLQGKWKLAVALIVLALLLVLAWLNGDMLALRLADLVDAGDADPVRRDLWAAARRMIDSAPWLGLGLGTYADAYPLYADSVSPYLMDKAHNDYLELAAGLGLPAALCWWAAIAWSWVRMAHGAITRRKHRLLPLVGMGATVLVAVHSTVDFSLQIPAIAMSYAALLGLGLAQSFSSRD